MIEGAVAAPNARRRVASLAVPRSAAARLTFLVAASAAVRFVLAWWLPVPWIFADELKYSEAAKSLAATGHFALRDVPGLGVGPLYPLLISPAYALFENVPHAYLAIKALNSVVVSLAAVPAYLLARRLVSEGWALVAAGLTLAIPSLAYSGMVMTENLFFPLFLTAALVMVAVLERPSLRNQLAAVALLGLGLLTRPQAIALVPAFLTAIALVAVGDAVESRERRRFLRSLGRFEPTFLLLAACGAAVALRATLRGHSVFASFGDAQGVWHQGYRAGSVARWLLYHVAELDLYSGVIPFAAFIVLGCCVLARRDRQLRVVAAVGLSLAFWMLLTVSAFVSNVATFDPSTPLPRIMDRYTFYLLPLLLVALVAWLSGRLPHSTRTTVAAAAIAGLLPLAIPFRTVLRNDAIPDSFGLMPWSVIRGGRLLATPHVTLRVGAAALVLAGLFVLLRHDRFARIVPVLVLLVFLATLSSVVNRTHATSSFAALWIKSDTGWIDETIGPDADAPVIWSGTGDPHRIWESEFFNRSVGTVYYLRTPSWAGLPEQQLRVRRGVLVDTAGRPLRARFVLADPWVVLRGRVIARDRTSGMRLYRLDGRPARIGAL